MALARVQRQEVEPLSPKSANIQYKPKSSKQTDAKDMVDEEAKRIEAAKKAAKEKEYAPVPPEWVIQPPVSKGGLAEKYRTGKLLGKGGFAMAYEGELRNKSSEMNQRVFALKVVRAKMSQRKMEEKFRTELQIHAKMRHPNIVEFHRAFTYKESTYVVLEMCPNGSVMDMVKKRRCLTLPEVRRLTVQLCGAIKYMHARSVIHRDLKMGNLFLDHEMNLKIGDFGLAAVLVSKDEYEGLFDYAKSRRTTLCGTPNYIAPEILEKGKGGHDHKVDIWAIGVILFAMIAGQPPFQSSSQNEIYKRARNVDYAWPEEGKHSNDIPEEAKDLVARLLKVDADKRPDPDHIVGHSFFSMHGGDAIPVHMEEHFRYEKPHYLDQKAWPRGDVMLKGTERLSLRTLAKQCGVGYLPGCLAPQTAVGADIDLSLYKECAAEEADGLGPVVPVPKDSVYVSRYSFGVNNQQRVDQTDFQPQRIPQTIKEDFVASRRKQEMEPLKAKVERARRAPVQSHAATLRAAQFSSNPNAPRMDTKALENDLSKTGAKPSTIGAATARRGLLNELPVRPTSNPSSINDQIGGNVERKPRATRSKKTVTIDEVAKEEIEKPRPRRPMTKDECIDATSSDPDKKRSDIAARTRARIASNVQKEMSDEPVKERKVSLKSGATGSDSIASSTGLPQSLIGPDEVVEIMPSTKPDEVLRSLRTLHRNLENSLNNLTRGTTASPPDKKSIEAGKRSFKHRPVVVKWVDYTNKFGIGYILANGTVGCVFKGEGTGATTTTNPTCIVVADSETHLKKRKILPSYAEKHQILPRRSPPVEFIENCGDEGLKRVLCLPSQFQVKVSASGVVEKLGPGVDIYDFEKRRKLCLWDKFGKYMTQSLGKAEEGDLLAHQPDDDVSSRKKSGTEAVAGPYVKFYQRLGNVGVWGFGDGAFQFNFPDHTKLFVDARGQWADFYHLPLEAARALHEGRRLEASDLADRSVLTFPIDVLLRGEYEGQVFGDVLRENELEGKLGFVRDLVGFWVREGGVGRMGRKRGVHWGGVGEESGKKVWVTVGARGGDCRYEAAAAAAS